MKIGDIVQRIPETFGETEREDDGEEADAEGT